MFGLSDRRHNDTRPRPIFGVKAASLTDLPTDLDFSKYAPLPEKKFQGRAPGIFLTWAAAPGLG